LLDDAVTDGKGAGGIPALRGGVVNVGVFAVLQMFREILRDGLRRMPETGIAAVFVHVFLPRVDKPVLFQYTKEGGKMRYLNEKSQAKNRSGVT
jgi:hypothetical protein